MLRVGLAFLVLVASLVLVRGDEPAPPETFSADQRSHWAFQTPTRPELPEVKQAGWVRNPIDQFILSGLEILDLTPSAKADRVALLRRITYDLTGLPPTPAEVESFLADTRPDAYERRVDRLLESPAYGVRWAQHWLDLAHYADSNGFELDAERPDAWRYRDWVVRALNDDMPYDRFLALQLAGDEILPGDHDALIATGFGRSGPREVVGGNIDPAVRRQSELTEITGTVGSVFLGLTVTCARCHDHKFDPIPTTDYYRLQSYFAAAELVEIPIGGDDEEQAHKAAVKAAEEQIAPIRRQLADLEAPYRATLKASKEQGLTAAEREVLAIPAKERTPAQQKIADGAGTQLMIRWEEVAEAVAENPADHERREALKRQIFEIENTLPRPPAKAMALAESKSTAPPTHVYRRGEIKNLGPEVAPRPPGILLDADAAAIPETEPTETSTGRRSALARWLASSNNPLAARVIVNRLWMHHFGRGIVASANDFGTRGESPTHPELLDWLAAELVREGWRLKPIHRLMATSATYRQASNTRQGRETDPENTMLWRMNRRRLEAEGLRDSLLGVTGELNPEMGGPGVLVPIEKEIEDLIFTEAEVVDLWPETPDPDQHLRRSLYLFRKRNVRYPMFDAFDAPDTQSACAQRNVSTHAPQALVLMNGDFAVDRARALAGRVLKESDNDQGAALDALYRRVLARPPRPEERARDVRFLEAQAARLADMDEAAKLGTSPPSEALPGAMQAAWVDLALAMLNRNEFLYVP